MCIRDSAFLGHGRDLVGGGGDEVVAGSAGLELGVHGFVGVVGVNDHAALIVALELLDQPGVNVVGPRIDVQHGLLFAAATQDNQCGQQKDRPQDGF